MILPAYPLWSEGTPGALGDAEHDIPTITPHLPDPDKATGAAMVVFAGGGYEYLADHEGTGYAQWLAGHGIAAFVVKYRLGSHGYRHPAMLHDAARGVRTVRARAAEYGIDPNRVGVMGSSAGGHLVSTIVTQFDAGVADHVDPIERESSRPDLGILCYPLVSMVDNTHQGATNLYLGTGHSPEEAMAASAEKNVKENTPPCFIWHTWEDGVVDTWHPLIFAMALREKGVRFEVHMFEKGRHGLGLGKTGIHRWTNDLLAWLQEREFVK